MTNQNDTLVSNLLETAPDASIDVERGRFFVPSESSEQFRDWIEHLVMEWEERNVERAVVLVRASTDAAWFRFLTPFPKCFIHGRVKFEGPEQNGNSATFPSVLVGLGIDVDRFAEVFGELGDIVVPYWPAEATQPVALPDIASYLTPAAIAAHLDAGLEMMRELLEQASDVAMSVLLDYLLSNRHVDIRMARDACRWYAGPGRNIVREFIGTFEDDLDTARGKIGLWLAGYRDKMKPEAA